MRKRPPILMTPGPTPVPSEVLAAQARPVTHHRTPEFGEIMREVTTGLRRLMGTQNDVVVYTSSGTGAMESAVANLLSPGERILVVSVGYFGQRFNQIASRFGADVELLEYEWGQVAQAEDVALALEKDPSITSVFVQHSETSTGVVNDIESVAKAVKSAGRLLVVDAISSAGAVELEVDAWGIDVCLGGSQKALGASPGISFVSIGQEAWQAHSESSLPRFYWDWTAYKEALDRDPPQPPWTTAVSVIYGLAESLRMIEAEGKEEILDRHKQLGRAVKAGIQALGLDVFGEHPQRAHVVTAVRVPEGLSDVEIVRRLSEDHRILVEKGQGPLRGQVFRIGHLGWVEPLDVIRLMGALEMVLAGLGYTSKFGAGVAAAEEVFGS